MVCTAGPGQGQEFELHGDEVVIGRAAENPISVSDNAMSRKHGVVRSVGGGWAVSDLSSGNGTTLNGVELSEETPLANDDVIGMGDSEFTFVGPDDEGVSRGQTASVLRRVPVRTARQQGELPVRSRHELGVQTKSPDSFRKLLIRFGAVLAVVLALGVGWRAVDNKKRAELALQRQQLEGHRSEMDAEFQEAKRLAREGQWSQAKLKLMQMQADDPEYEAKSVQQYLARAELEIPNQQVLAVAEAALEAGELGNAAAALSKVQNTLGFTETQRSALAEQLEARIVAKVAEGRGLLAAAGDAPKMERLKALAEDLLAARPDSREGLELKRQAEVALARMRSPSVPVAVAATETPWAEVQDQFRAGDFGSALSAAQACSGKYAQCRALETALKEFETKLKSLDALPEGELVALFELDRRIAGGSSSQASKPIRTRMAAQFFLKASQAKTTGNWAKVIEHARRVLLADPNHAGALGLMSEARSQAKDLYLRGYQLRDSTPDEAAKLFKAVIGMTPADDEYHKKASARLADLLAR